ncbi:hypothetical protein RGQ15_06995 [Paracoccus sp. MBLB3053]|uniref:Uncharacterized protein n=1 Tax=Paracoccus aurantius TaxID=3073814 RepID=A0ABU2HRT6_9RHOB|nr:hypothetical protein [Paracoccus sp. MBLB3053]MDS9467319.1 hypothetical protein [Paracoccus sp. MBLB3053]
MTSALKSLADDLDRLTENGNASVVETQTALTIAKLEAAEAHNIWVSVNKLGWPITAEDEAGEPVLDELGFDPALGQYILTCRKPDHPDERLVVTKAGLRQGLSEPGAQGNWQVVCCQVSFATGLFQISPLGAEDVFVPASPVKSPQEIVRETIEPRRTPSDIRKWLIRGGVTDDRRSDPAFEVFAEEAAPRLARAICSECGASEDLIFLGPPRMTLRSAPGLYGDLTPVGIASLNNAVAWVYEDPAATEQRHGLLAAEIARLATRGETLAHFLNGAGSEILQNARLAYQLSLSELSREAIKTQGDLRKAIADDTTKAAESTRTLSTAIAVSIATAITLITARSTGSADPWVISVIAGVVAAYLVTIAINGWMHLRLQRRLREQWRRRFYNFVAQDDYDAMVTIPARDAERPYNITGYVSIFIALILGALSFASVFHGNQTEEPKELEQSLQQVESKVETMPDAIVAPPGAVQHEEVDSKRPSSDADQGNSQQGP